MFSVGFKKQANVAGMSFKGSTVTPTVTKGMDKTKNIMSGIFAKPAPPKAGDVGVM